MKAFAISILLCAFGFNAASAQTPVVVPEPSFKISISIRETGGSGPVFSDAGLSGGGEWVNKDGQALVADGTWQLFTFTPSVDPLTPFFLANGVLDTDWGSFEHIRILNSSGVSLPIKLWIDDLNNTSSAWSATESFESFAPGTQVVFHQPRFTGSTEANLMLEPNTSLVTDTTAHSGVHSDEINFQFVDSDPTRWLRLTTARSANLPTPAMLLREDNYNPTISFYAKIIVVPEPSFAAFLVLTLLALWSGQAGERGKPSPLREGLGSALAKTTCGPHDALTY